MVAQVDIISGEKTIMDFSAGFGTSEFGGVFSLRTLDDGGRLPGLAEDLQNVQAKLTYKLGSSLKLSAEVKESSSLVYAARVFA